MIEVVTARKLPIYVVFSGPYFSVFGLNADSCSVRTNKYSDLIFYAVSYK